MELFARRQEKESVNIQFTMIIDLFISHLREKECKYFIHNDKEFIHPPPVRKRVSIFNS